MRQLASIKIINDIHPIEGRDRIELAIIDGWSVIVKKGEFQIGDKCVYIEIDSVLPEKPEFEFLRSKNFRIKTMKMAGVLSQGICFPLSILPDANYELNQDVTDIIGVKKYEPTTDDYVQETPKKKYNPLMRFKWYRTLIKGKRKSDAFPSIIPKTDETRIQNMPFILQDKTSNWVVTEKIDGQSGSFILIKHKSIFGRIKYEYIVCSRNRRLTKKDDSSYWQVSDKYHIEDCLKDMIAGYDWIAIQGECISPKVQGNKYKVTEPDLYVFNLIDPRNGRFDSITAKYMCEQRGLKFVPIIETNFTLPDTVEEMLKYAHGDSVLGNTIREGVVVRNIKTGASFKAVDPEFLLQYDI